MNRIANYFVRTRPARMILRLCLACMGLVGTPGLAAELDLNVRGIETAAGMIMIAVVNSEAAFNGEAPPVLSLLVAARPGSVSFRTDALPEGDYGIRVMHDENGNGDMDSNMVGMPIEPWGFSNNAMGNFGPPGWSDVRFRLSGSTTTVIDLNH